VDYAAKVLSLVHAQEQLCKRLLREAEELIKQLNPEDGSNPLHPDDPQREIDCCSIAPKSAARARPTP
jgi:hypothetical protein